MAPLLHHIAALGLATSVAVAGPIPARPSGISYPLPTMPHHLVGWPRPTVPPPFAHNPEAKAKDAATTASDRSANEVKHEPEKRQSEVPKVLPVEFDPSSMFSNDPPLTNPPYDFKWDPTALDIFSPFLEHEPENQLVRRGGFMDWWGGVLEHFGRGMGKIMGHGDELERRSEGTAAADLTTVEVKPEVENVLVARGINGLWEKILDKLDDKLGHMLHAPGYDRRAVRRSEATTAADLTTTEVDQGKENPARPAPEDAHRGPLMDYLHDGHFHDRGHALAPKVEGGATAVTGDVNRKIAARKGNASIGDILKGVFGNFPHGHTDRRDVAAYSDPDAKVKGGAAAASEETMKGVKHGKEKEAEVDARQLIVPWCTYGEREHHLRHGVAPLHCLME
ncbi:hypothetical protein LTR09_010572 [Extremus antarcticus]|uniref:Uncharacterized protein n=1 Tax=Extremus antarcticus TaxID=702011 RepID=A0AAJ0DDJ0_9PEZI|nr:hypothetical protein LTR09_010572 [Extremus antarcticus]